MSSNVALISNDSAMMPPQQIWQAAKSFCHYHKVMHVNKDKFYTDAAEGVNVCIFGDDEKIMTYTKNGKVRHTDMSTLRTRNRDGVDVDIEAPVPTAFDRFRRRPIDDIDPIFEQPLLSDSDVEETKETGDTNPEPYLQAEGSETQDARTNDSQDYVADLDTLHDIPGDVRDLVRLIRRCPAEIMAGNHGLPTRNWLHENVHGINSRHKVFLSKKNDPPLAILNYVGDARLFNHRLWAYLIFNGAARPQGQAGYERDYFYHHGEAFGLVKKDFLSKREDRDPSPTMKFSSMNHDEDRRSPISPSPTTTAREKSTKSGLHEFSTAGPFLGRGPCSDAVIKKRFPSYQEADAVNSCTPHRQECLHHSKCGHVICQHCDASQLDQLSEEGDTSGAERSVLLGALMPLCQDCQGDILSKRAQAKQQAFDLANGQDEHVNMEDDQNTNNQEPHPCVCTSWQCLPCLRDTAADLTIAREKYGEEHRVFSIKLHGQHVDVNRCPCGKDISGRGVNLQNTGSEIDQVRVCALCSGYKTRDEMLGSAKGEFGLKGRIVEWWAGCEGILR